MKFADNSICSCPGLPFKTVYAPKVGPNGSVELVESGLENTDEFIQSFKEATDIRTILNRVANGETQLLMQRTGSYGDFTKMPKTFAEVLQLQIDSHKLFESLPIDIRQQFNNDANEFFAASGTGEWFKKIEGVLPDEVKAMVMPKPDTNVKEEVEDVKE